MRKTLSTAFAIALSIGCSTPPGGASSSSEPARTSKPEPARTTSASASASAQTAPSSSPKPEIVLDDAAVRALSLTPDGEKAVRTLASADHFGGWAVGVAGTPTEAVSALRAVWKEKNAEKAFQLVIDKGTLDGQLMALAGLYDVDRGTFDEELARLEGVKGDVHLMTSGCAPGGDPVPASTVLRKVGAVHLDGPKDGLLEWSKRNPDKPIVFDIAGGGYTAVMRPR